MYGEEWDDQQQLLLLERTAAKLRTNRMGAEVVSGPQQLLERLEEMIPAGANTASGGSVTLERTGVLNWLKTGKTHYVDGDPHASGQVDRAQVQFCDYFFMSTNAVTLDGELYNVDGNGNRVSALIYGPAHVIVVAGCNKVVQDLAAAEQRVKMIAAPRNCIRLHRETGCAKTGYCVGCKAEERICCHTVISAFQRVQGRIHVFLLPGSYGF